MCVECTMSSVILTFNCEFPTDEKYLHSASNDNTNVVANLANIVNEFNSHTCTYYLIYPFYIILIDDVK